MPLRLSPRLGLQHAAYHRLGWQPTQLGSKLKVWLDPSDLTSMYQGRNGGDQAAVDQVVGLILDKSQMGGKTVGSFIAGQPELVTNGTFDSDITGWNDISSGPGQVVEWSAGKLRIVGNGAFFARAEQSIGTVAGRTYLLTLDYSGLVNLNHKIKVGSSQGDDNIVSNTQLFDGINSFVFDALGASTSVTFEDGNSEGEMLMDDVSVKEVPGNHFTAPSDSARGILRNSGGLWSIEFDGVDDFYRGAVISEYITALEYELGFAGQAISIGTDIPINTYQNDPFLADSIGYFGAGHLLSTGPVARSYNWDGSDDYNEIEISLGENFTWLQRHDAGLLIAQKNNEAEASTASGTTLQINNPLQIGGRDGAYARIHFHGVVICNAVLTAGERASLRSYLAGKTGVTL